MPSQKKKVQKFASLEKLDFASKSLERRGDVYAMKFDSTPVFITPLVTLKEPVITEDGDLTEYTTLKLKSSHASIIKNVEQKCLDAACANKETWFGNDDLTDEFLESCMVKFFDPATRYLKVKIDESVSSRPEVGQRVKVVLEVDVLFTRSQFGIVWKAVIFKKSETSEDMYLFDPEDNEEFSSVTMAPILDAQVAEEPEEDEIVVEEEDETTKDEDIIVNVPKTDAE